MVQERFTTLLTKKLSGEISPEELAEFNSLVAGNASFKYEYESIQSYWSRADEPYDNVVTIFDSIKRKAGIEIDNEPVRVVELNGPKKKTLWPRTIAAAAAILALITAGFYFLKPKGIAETTNGVILTQLKTNSGATATVRLPDGTSVTLNAATVLKYPKAFAGNTREVYLSGEAFFDVAKDHSHPFIVHTNRSDIRVLGTAFNIKSYDNDSLFEATLFRGSIQASVRNQPGNNILLKPSDKLVIGDAGYFLSKETHLESDTTNIETAWMHNKVIFKDQPFGLLANSLSRKYGVNIIFKNNDLKPVKLTGEFDKENISQVLASLKVVAKFKYKTSGNEIYIF